MHLIQTIHCLKVIICSFLYFFSMHFRVCCNHHHGFCCFSYARKEWHGVNQKALQLTIFLLSKISFKLSIAHCCKLTAKKLIPLLTRNNIKPIRHSIWTVMECVQRRFHCTFTLHTKRITKMHSTLVVIGKQPTM